MMKLVAGKLVQIVEAHEPVSSFSENSRHTLKFNSWHKLVFIGSF